MARAHTNARRMRQEGAALLIALITLCIFSTIGLYLALISTAEVRISDNFEGYHRARSAALAGLSHARELMRGIRFNDLLEGPDGTHNANPAYTSSAKSHAFRMPISWAAARIVDIANPSGAFAGVPDDGVVNTGCNAGGNGLSLIPLTGIVHIAANPNGPGVLITARYFVKATDNNGEPEELTGDPADDPFVDGDGQIIVRSLGIAQTLPVGPQAATHNNSVVVVEARFKRYSTFALDAPVVIQSSAVSPSAAAVFSGANFLIDGGLNAPGIAVIDTSLQDGIRPDQEILSRLGPNQMANVLGTGIPPVLDITPAITAHAEKRLLLDQASSWRFIRQSAPQFADSALLGPQSWNGAAPVFLGSYDPALPPTSPGQDPRATYVDGDLIVDGSLTGGGLLVVTGKLTIQGHFAFNGLILIIGAGELDVRGWSTITGGIFLAGLSNANGNLAWGTAKLSVADSCRIRFDRGSIQAAINLIPATQLGCREITPIIDP